MSEIPAAGRGGHQEMDADSRPAGPPYFCDGPADMTAPPRPTDDFVAAVRDVCWKAAACGEDEDGWVTHYLIPAGALHRLVAVSGAPLRSKETQESEQPKSWFLEEYERAKALNAKTPPHAQMVITSPKMTIATRSTSECRPDSGHQETDADGRPVSPVYFHCVEHPESLYGEVTGCAVGRHECDWIARQAQWRAMNEAEDCCYSSVPITDFDHELFCELNRGHAGRHYAFMDDLEGTELTVYWGSY